MLEPDLSFLLSDPALGSEPFLLFRPAFAQGPDGEPAVTYRALNATGILQPGAFSFSQDPAQDVTEMTLKIYSATSLAPEDMIRWQNRVWRVREIEDWSTRGYCVAIATLTKEAQLGTNL